MKLPNPYRCRRTIRLVDIVLAEGDLIADELAHVAGCPACARALAEAYAFERELSRVGHGETPEPLPLATSLVAARDLELREDHMTVRPPIRLAVAAIGVVAALASLFLLQPPRSGEVATSARTTPTAGESIAGTVGASEGLRPTDVADLLRVPAAQILPVPGGAVAARIVDGTLELAAAWGASAATADTGILAADPLEIDASAGTYLQTVGVTCTAGPFAGRSFVFGATDEPGILALSAIRAEVVGGPGVGQHVAAPDVRPFLFAVADGEPHRSYLVIAQGINPADSSYGVGGGFVPWDCSGSPESVMATVRAETAALVELGRRARSAARDAAPAGAALMSAAACGSDLVSVLWPPAGDSSARVVIAPDAGASREVTVSGPDAPEVARLRARLDGPCAELPNPMEQRDYDLLPDLEGVRRTLDADYGARGTMTVAYPTTSEAIIGVAPNVNQPGAGTGVAGRVAVARRIGTEWRLVGVVEAPGMRGLAHLGLVHIGALQGADGDYAIVYGTPAGPEPVTVNLTVEGITFSYPIARAGLGFVAVLPASAEQEVTYRYLAANGEVLEEGSVAAD